MLSWRILESRRRFTEQAKEEDGEQQQEVEVEEVEGEEEQEVNTCIKVRGLEKAGNKT